MSRKCITIYVNDRWTPLADTPDPNTIPASIIDAWVCVNANRITRNLHPHCAVCKTRPSETYYYNGDYRCIYPKCRIPRCALWSVNDTKSFDVSSDPPMMCGYCLKELAEPAINCHVCQRQTYCNNECRRRDKSHQEVCFEPLH